MKNINKFLMLCMALVFGQISATAQPCTLVCPGDQIINLDPGACEAVIGYNVTTAGNCGAPVVDFTGDFDVANWVFTGVPTTSVDVSGAPASVTITGSTGGGGDALLCITVASAGDLSFDWAYSTTDGQFWDPFGYTVNGAFTELTNGSFGASTNAGAETVALVAGDEFCFNQNSADGIGGPGITTISNFGFIGPVLEPVLSSGLASGSGFPIGTSTVTYTLPGTAETCTWTYTVIENVPTSNDITCNSSVNISLDANCQAVVGADQILEGNNYGCYDNFTVTFASGPNVGQPVVLGPGDVGVTYQVMVTNPAGNPCWGYINVEDKIAPIMTCYDVELACTDFLPTVPAPENSQAGSIQGAPANGTDNQGAVGGTVYFDLTNGSAFPIDFSANMNIGQATLVDVYIIPGTHVGNTNAAAGWTLIGQVDATAGPFSTGQGDGTLTPTTGTVSIPSGTFGVALHALTSDHFYTNATNTFTDGTVTITTGTASNGLFNGNFNPRSFSGTFEYAQSFPAVPVTDACDANPTVTFEDVVQDMGCTGAFSEIITRTWTAEDASGNSTTCVSTYFRQRATLATIVFPADIVIDCSQTPDAATTGAPTGFECGNITYTAEADIVVDICEGSKKILRKFIAIDWCTNTTQEHTQIIEVLDTNGPSITCPSDITMGASSNACSGNIALPSVVSTDDCSGVASTVFSSTVGSINNGILSDVPAGTHTVTVTVTDNCGNVSDCTFDVTVVDNIAPIAICDEHTVVSIGSDGQASIPASTFDDGSFDNCGPITMDVRRMDNSACSGNDATSYGPFAPFFCCDIGSVVMVQLRVTDASGNTNTCMVEVEVQDKLAPTIICPSDKNLDCDDNYMDLALTGEATAIDNCDGVTVTFNDISNTVNDCGEGSITRVWTATDGVGLTASCIQTINVSNQNPFDGNTINFPLDFTVNTCGTGLQPGDLAPIYSYPTFTEGDCDNIALTFTDQELGFGAQDACLTILRKWILIDWCQVPAGADPTNPATPGVWHHVQVLKVINSSDPVITAVNTPSSFDNFDSGCGNVFAAFSVTADDDCTDQADLDVTWSFNTGLSGTGFNASGAFANGSYSLTYTVDDQCGNSTSFTHNFTVADAKKPTPVCIFGIATTVMPSAGMVTIWASDFESGSSFDNCTDYSNLQFSFSTDVTNTSLTVACTDIPADGLFPVTLYVTDANGNFDFCSTFISVQDPNAVCGGGPTVAGVIETEYQETVDDVTVNLTDNSGPMATPIVTLNNGLFSFNMNPSDYDLTPEKDIDYLNGVTTYDLVLISKHILGTQVFDTPYKWIAADANKTNTITTLDIVKLRALILHIDDELAGNDSWRFVDTDYTFVNPNNPLAENFPEVIDLATTTDPSNADFVGVKIGDVNGTAVANSLLGTDTRTFNGNLALQLDATKVAQGETFTVDFKAKDFNNIDGYQFTLGFENVEFVDVTSNLAGLETSNFGLTKLNEGVITTSWNATNSVSLDDNTVLFSMTFVANAAINTSDVFAINSRYTESEAYSGSDLFNVAIEFNGATAANGFDLYQNTPNPFKAETTIGFNLPEAGEVTLKVFDVSGRILRLVEIDGAKGFNSVNVNREGLNATGVLYYQLETATETATKKMIIVD